MNDRQGDRIRGEEKITKRLMSDMEAAKVDPSCTIEHFIYAAMRKMCEAYDGGLWKYYRLSNGAWFMVPTDQASWVMKDCNDRKHRVSAEAAGLAVMLYVANHMAWKLHGDGEAERRDATNNFYFALRAYAAQSKEFDAIDRILD